MKKKEEDDKKLLWIQSEFIPVEEAESLVGKLYKVTGFRGNIHSGVYLILRQVEKK